MHTDFHWSELLGQYMTNAQMSADRLAKETKIPKQTIISWRKGNVGKPRDWQDLVKIALALQLSEDKASLFLQAAGHVAISSLLAGNLIERDRVLLDYWATEIEARPPEPEIDILILDDEKKWRDTLKYLLTPTYHIKTVSTYAAACKQLTKKDPPFHVALVDMSLSEDAPNQEGFELVELLNRLQASTKTIIVTGYASVEVARTAFKDLAVFDMVEKDDLASDPNAFRDLVRQAVEAAKQEREG